MPLTNHSLDPIMAAPVRNEITESEFLRIAQTWYRNHLKELQHQCSNCYGDSLEAIFVKIIGKEDKKADKERSNKIKRGVEALEKLVNLGEQWMEHCLYSPEGAGFMAAKDHFLRLASQTPETLAGDKESQPAETWANSSGPPL